MSLTLALSGACGSGSGVADTEDRRQVEGLVVEVVDRNIDQVETLRVKDGEGRVWTFTTEDYLGITPSHLREHQLFGERVVVVYRAEKGRYGDRLVALEINDPPD
ncbi:MAG: hypothetical protein BZY88_19245 [SAR202 cluster bacterium Io17-Chloro-G9]|nr:MAG: hypothetical protein BZY88_19245 [SAR202 cluster bacterium Io17-Chloro-G9]